MHFHGIHLRRDRFMAGSHSYLPVDDILDQSEAHAEMDHIETEPISDTIDHPDASLYESTAENTEEYEVAMADGDNDEPGTEEKADSDYVPAGEVKRVSTGRVRRAGRPSADRRKKGVVKREKAPDNGVGARPFQLKWLLEFEWLRYDPEKKKMYCNWCTETNKKNAFGKAEGTNNFRKSNCDEHTKSRDHQTARQQHKNGLAPDYQTEPEPASVEESAVVYSVHPTNTTSVSFIPVSAPNLMTSQEVRFHAKKAGMLLSGLLVSKNLPPSLAKEFLEIMPFMFPDSTIAAELQHVP